MAVEKGDKVRVEYTGTLENGEVFDSTERHGGEPLEFVVGAGEMIKGFDEAVLGMEEGEEKEITLGPGEAYGDHNPDYVQKLPAEKFPAGVQEGMTIGINTTMGQIPARVVEVGPEEITVDMNSPLAGKTLNFKLKVVGVEKAKPQEENSQE